MKNPLAKKTNSEINNISNGLEYIFKRLQAIEQYLWETNIAENQIFHDLILNNLKKRPNFHPLVSIVIPVYNGQEFIKKAINSALAQTYDNIEIIVIDDGSTDETEKILKSYGDKIIFYSKPNGGVSSALNLGIKKMHGEYFSWLSHDDLFNKDHIEHLVNWVSYAGHEKDIPFSLFHFIDNYGHIIYQDTVAAQLIYSDFKISYTKNELTLLEGEINGGSVLIPKKAFDECGTFNESLRVAQERDLWSRLIKKYHFVNIPFDTSSIRVHPNQVSNTNPKVAEESNAKQIEIIDNLSEESINNLFSDRLLFYENLQRSYHNNAKTVLEDHVKTKISEIKNHVK